MLKVGLDGNEIVIRIDADALALASKAAFEKLYGAPSGFYVKDNLAFARDVLKMLEDKDHRGSTLVTELLDMAMLATLDSGCESVLEGP